ncbi:hypothetical protein [Caudoviricetes sp.]|nr:hypothetical protein [Caudoviricetes sp.]
MLAHEILTGKPQAITTILDATRDSLLKDFKCNCCGRIVFQYYGGIMLLIPGELQVEWIDIVGRPKPIQCKNKRLVRTVEGREVEVKCKTMYFVVG